MGVELERSQTNQGSTVACCDVRDPGAEVRRANEDSGLAGRAASSNFSRRLPLRGAAVDLLDLQSDRPIPLAGVFSQGAQLQRDGLLVVGGNAGLEAGTKRFRRFPYLAKNRT
ncbi:MAG: hypothetical protein ABSE56_15320 [Bryobacteraceae bacterium]|jgi:hypothetical protein